MQTLRSIAAKYDTDKRTRHVYIPWYEHVLEPIRRSAQAVLEIGVARGESLRMWRDYFSCANIYGMDSDPSCRESSAWQIWTFVCDQRDAMSQESAADEIGGSWDLIVDDGSHRLEDQRTSCGVWLPRLHARGLYVIEDVQGAWRDHQKWLARIPNISYAFVSFSMQRVADDRLIVIRKM